MVGKLRRATSFGIGQRRRDRRGRTDIVKGRSVRSGGECLDHLSCSASGIFAICCDLTQPTITRLARTFRSTRTRRCGEQYMPLVAFCLSHFLAGSIICICEFDFRQAQGGSGIVAGSALFGHWSGAPLEIELAASLQTNSSLANALITSGDKSPCCKARSIACSICAIVSRRPESLSAFSKIA